MLQIDIRVTREKIAVLNAGYYRKGNPETISKLMLDLQVEF